MPADDVAQRVAERLAEDETLRGDLTDAGFNPILQWVTDAATAATQRTGAAALDVDALGDAARKSVRALVRAAEHGDTSALSTAFGEPLFTADDAAKLTAAVTSAPTDGDSDTRARALVQALSAQTPGAGTGAA